jgi:hypothetical protein
VLISNEGKEVITYIERHNRFAPKNGSFGPGNIGNPVTVTKTLGLTKVRKDLVHRFFLLLLAFSKLSIELNMQGCSFKMKYNGYSMRSLEKSNNKRDKVYKLEIVKIGAIKESEPEAPDWAVEAAKQPLLPAQLARGVPTQWSMHVPSGSNLRISVEQCKIFMDQIGHPHNHCEDVL